MIIRIVLFIELLLANGCDISDHDVIIKNTDESAFIGVARRGNNKSSTSSPYPCGMYEIEYLMTEHQRTNAMFKSLLMKYMR